METYQYQICQRNIQTIQDGSHIVDRLLFATWSLETNCAQQTPTQRNTSVLVLLLTAAVLTIIYLETCLHRQLDHANDKV